MTSAVRMEGGLPTTFEPEEGRLRRFGTEGVKNTVHSERTSFEDRPLRQARARPGGSDTNRKREKRTCKKEETIPRASTYYYVHVTTFCCLPGEILVTNRTKSAFCLILIKDILAKEHQYFLAVNFQLDGWSFSNCDCDIITHIVILYPCR